MAEPSQKIQAKKFPAPKGTRDFYPADLAVRRHIENVWRQVSINHGFEEIDGPTFEHLDLYTHKSGPGIASELFQVFSGKDQEQVAAMRAGEMAPYALRPEFTPTLARMVAARAPELPRPIKWFAIPSHFRAESPQRGRLREFMQWNVDFIGDATPQADADVIATAIQALARLGLTPDVAKVRMTDRNYIALLFTKSGVAPEQLPDAFDLLDRRPKLSAGDFAKQAVERRIDASIFDRIATVEGRRSITGTVVTSGAVMISSATDDVVTHLLDISDLLDEMGIGEWIELDHTIVRGLAYYTGTVFEIHEASGAERAIAGGGRYDMLVESFGGPKLPACGFGMGDVVLANILKDKGLLKPAEEYLPRPDAFVVAANDDAAAGLPKIVADLRRQNLHIRQSYKTTRNVGKLLGDAGKCRARYAVILSAELTAEPPRVALKNLDSGEQREVALNELAATLRAAQT